MDNTLAIVTATLFSNRVVREGETRRQAIDYCMDVANEIISVAAARTPIVVPKKPSTKILKKYGRKK